MTQAVLVRRSTLGVAMTSQRWRSAASASPVTARRPNPAVWQHALTLAGGDVRRLVVADDRPVVIGNDPAR